MDRSSTTEQQYNRVGGPTNCFFPPRDLPKTLERRSSVVSEEDDDDGDDDRISVNGGWAVREEAIASH